MRDRVCPIEECAGTVRFEDAVVEVTPRYRLHDLDDVDEFVTCPACDAAVAGFYPEDEDGGDVELILDIDDDGNGDDGTGGDGDEVDDDGFDAPVDGFEDPDEVLADAADGDAPEDGDEEPHEPVFGTGEDE